MPPTTPQLPQTADPSPTTTPSLKRPPRRPTRAERVPAIRDRPTFVEAHKTQAAVLEDYLTCPRTNFIRLSNGIMAELDRRRMRELYANNAWSRIAFADVVVPRVLALDDLHAGPVFLVTICVADHTVGLPEAKNFDCRRVKGLARQALEDISFIGMVEGALYKNFGACGPQIGDFVSWHSHVLTWGATRKAISAAVSQILRGRASLIPDRLCIHVKPIRSAAIASKLYYLLKGPQKEYRIYSRGDRIDLATGEVLGPVYRQTKRPLRTGDRARLCEAFEGRLLDKLFFGNGEGTTLCRAIRHKALEPFRAWQSSNPAKMTYPRINN